MGWERSNKLRKDNGIWKGETWGERFDEVVGCKKKSPEGLLWMNYS